MSAAKKSKNAKAKVKRATAAQTKGSDRKQAQDHAQEEAYRAEAERLGLLPVDVQRQALALIRGPADNPKLGKRDRETARERADALERLLRLRPAKSHAKAPAKAPRQKQKPPSSRS